MKSLYNRLLIALQAHLGANLPAIRYVELDLGQLEIFETRPAVAFPCALVRFAGSYQQRQFNTQLNNFTMSVKLGFDVYANTSNLVPLDVREIALSSFEIEQEFYLQLQNWTANGLLTTGLLRVSDGDLFDGSGMRKRLITFTGSFADASLNNV